MDPAGLVSSLEATIEKLDDEFENSDLPDDSPQLKQLDDQRMTLAVQQRQLAIKVFKEDDDAFKTLTSSIEKATEELNKEIATTQQIDKIISIAAEISSDADQLLKLLP